MACEDCGGDHQPDQTFGSRDEGWTSTQLEQQYDALFDASCELIEELNGWRRLAALSIAQMKSVAMLHAPPGGVEGNARPGPCAECTRLAGAEVKWPCPTAKHVMSDDPDELMRLMTKLMASGTQQVRVVHAPDCGCQDKHDGEGLPPDLLQMLKSNTVAVPGVEGLHIGMPKYDNMPLAMREEIAAALTHAAAQMSGQPLEAMLAEVLDEKPGGGTDQPS